MGIQIDTATDYLDLYDRLVDWLQVGSESPAWTLLRQESSDDAALFSAPGLSMAENIYVGIRHAADVGADAYNIGLWMFTDFNDALGTFDQPGASDYHWLTLWDSTLPYWFVANGQRLIAVAKTSTVYTAGYAGKFFPYGSPGEYPQPFYVGATTDTSNRRWSTTSHNDRNFWDPGGAAQIHTPAGAWQGVQNFFDNSGQEAAASNSIYVSPYQAYFDSLSRTDTRYRKLRENPDGSYSLWACTLLGTNPDNEIYGELDGVFAVTGFSAASEDIVQESGVDHLVVQDMSRTSRYNYAAIALE